MTGREKGLIGVTAVAGVVALFYVMDIKIGNLLKFDFSGGPPPAPAAGLEQPQLAFKQLASKNIAERKIGAEYLAKNPPTDAMSIDPEKRKAALQDLRTAKTEIDKEIQANAIIAFGKWATASESAELMRQATADRENPLVREVALDALARFKLGEALGKEEAEKTAKDMTRLFFENLHKEEFASKVETLLLSIGPAATMSLLPYTFHENEKLRLRANKLLDAYGTKPAERVKQALVELKIPNGTEAEKIAASKRQMLALKWLAKKQTDEPIPEVSKAAIAILRSEDPKQDPKARQEAFEVLQEWLAPSDVEPLHALLKSSKDDNLRKAIVIRLGNLKQPDSIPVLIESLESAKEREVARKALEAYGPVVEPAVMRVLRASVSGVGKEAVFVDACRILGTVAEEKQTIDQLEQLGKSADRTVRDASQAALKKIRERKATKSSGDPK